jgi:hypothetical protein
MWCGTSTIDEEFPVLEATAPLSQMITCVCKIRYAVRAMILNDEEAQRAAELKLQCAHVLYAIKYAREQAMSGTLYLFMMTRWFDATDRRDRIFALVGLTSDIDKSFVDYSKSYEDVIKELSLMLLDGKIEPTMGCVLDIWSFITRGEEGDITEPSWVVDLLNMQDSVYTPMMTAYPSSKPVIERSPEIQFLERDGTVVSCSQFLISFPN